MQAEPAISECCAVDAAAGERSGDDGVVRFLTHLFDTSDYPPRWQCGNWSSFEGRLHIASDAAIFAAYFAIPCVLLYFLLRRRDLPFPRIILLFGAFILSCGTGHLLEALIFWQPVYRAAGLLKCFTAIVSWFTVFALIRIIPEALKLPAVSHLNEQLTAEIEQRKRSEADVRAVLETAADAIISIDSRGTVTTVNAAAEKMFGYSPDEIVGCNIKMLMPPPYCEEHDRYLSEYLSTGVRKIIGIGREALGRRKDGTVFPIELAVSEVLLGSSRAFTGVVRDVTARKQAEQELQHYNRQLREAGRRLQSQAEELESKTRDLEAARRGAEQANRSKDEFLANMSHEIRTPMTAILGFAELLAGDAELVPGNRAEAIQAIRSNGEYLLEVINDILDLSKIEAGKLEVERIDFSPQEVIDDVLRLMRVRAQAKNLPLAAEFETSIPPTIRSDPTRLRQILINLVGNAVKFTQRGSVRVVTRLAEPADGRPALEIRVVDTGIGMSGEQTARLFRPFTQLDASTTRKFGGTGLGLAISRRLVEMLGGSIAVSSQPGRGTTFTIVLPTGSFSEGLAVGPATVSRSLAAKGDASDARPADAGGARLEGRILLAEDGADNQRLISFLLRKAGAEVIVVENGRLACEAVQQAVAEGRPYDLVLMDMQMPVLDGYDATRRLRQENYGGAIVALTAHAMAGDRQRCLDAGCDDYAAKPIDRHSLIRLARRYLPGAALGS